eukprot:TRINITY_DN17909_c0_g1_i2.p1 TRINITY_DN17909_c0_g1~~TRINITY_DN17909_c0_g1_i2.p1  ORF type:complete len:278 (+),score=104.68 TRINITY_DN17909_c0_g1_i2:64-897(+)
MADGEETRRFVVMANGSADYRTITEALRDAGEGDVISVKLGQYDEKIVVEKNVTIEGDPSTDATDIIVNGGVVLKASAKLKHIAVTNTVEVRAGEPVLEECDISEGFDGVKISKGCNPTLVRNNIHHARQGGDCIYLAEGANATIEDNDIHNARVNGIHVNGANCTITKNRIHSCHYGVFFRRRAKGTMERNTIQDCATFGVYIIQSADPTVLRNNIMACQIHTIMVSQDGMGAIRENMCNGSLTVKKGCVPQLENNQVLGKLDNENVVDKPDSSLH